ncbi:MAG TPA: hypothetical protein PK037_03785, partial [Saprospiraceae bacterium]|nr:hypothetical protein [Saprospiraceae bacterium]
MKRYLTITTALMLMVLMNAGAQETANVQAGPVVPKQSNLVVMDGGRMFRDLNKNNRLDIYEDIQQSIEARIEDLLSQMSVAEKAGMMFINGAPVSEDGLPDGKLNIKGPAARMPSVVENMNARKMNHFNIWEIPDNPEIFAKWYNNTQRAAEKTRLGIPVTIASDPRHHLGKNVISM